MTDNTVLPPPQHRPSRPIVVAMSLCECIGIADLCMRYEAGEDLAETLNRLLQMQEMKKKDGITRQDMLDVIDDPILVRGREGLAAWAHIRRFIAKMKQK